MRLAVGKEPEHREYHAHREERRHDVYVEQPMTDVVETHGGIVTRPGAGR